MTNFVILLNGQLQVRGIPIVGKWSATYLAETIEFVDCTKTFQGCNFYIGLHYILFFAGDEGIKNYPQHCSNERMSVVEDKTGEPHCLKHPHISGGIKPLNRIHKANHVQMETHN